jgi:hypothetical protein
VYALRDDEPAAGWGLPSLAGRPDCCLGSPAPALLKYRGLLQLSAHLQARTLLTPAIHDPRSTLCAGIKYHRHLCRTTGNVTANVRTPPHNLPKKLKVGALGAPTHPQRRKRSRKQKNNNVGQQDNERTSGGQQHLTSVRTTKECQVGGETYTRTKDPTSPRDLCALN